MSWLVDRNLKSKIKLYMQSQGLSLNAKMIEIKCNQSILSLIQIQLMCEVFGLIEKIETKEKSFLVTFVHSTDAMIAMNSFSDIKPEDLGCEFEAEWFVPEEILRVFEIMPTPDVFVPINKKTTGNSKFEPPEAIKYLARFPISMIDPEGFHLYEKLLGAKGCNFRKIVEICAKDFVIPERPKDLIKLKIKNGAELEIKLTSRYSSKFNTACGLLYELITVVFEEYKRYCEIQGINPSDLRVRKLEQIKGRTQIFRERKENPLIYSIPGIQ